MTKYEFWSMPYKAKYFLNDDIMLKINIETNTIVSRKMRISKKAIYPMK